MYWSRRRRRRGNDLRSAIVIAYGRWPVSTQYCAGGRVSGAYDYPPDTAKHAVWSGGHRDSLSAYEQTLRELGLKDRSDPLTEIVAKKVIEIRQTGIRDPAQIFQLTIKELGLQ
jgi:hypothetical protein